MKLYKIYRNFNVRYHFTEASELYTILSEFYPELLELNNITSFSDLTLGNEFNTHFLLASGGTISLDISLFAISRIPNLRKSVELYPGYLIERHFWGIKGVIENGVLI